MTPLLTAKNLTKKYGALTALDNATLTLHAGEVRSLVGANGAGKSTLIKILTGAIEPNSAQILLEGKQLPLADPTAMLNAGIACIYQHSNLVPELTVLDNISLGRQATKSFSRLDRAKQRRDAEQLLAKYRLDLDLDAKAKDLPTVRQKEVEIAKALALNAKVLLMDEPTAWLSHSEVANLFTTIRHLQKTGVGIIYISHMLDELYSICDTVTIMRDGKIVADCHINELTREQLLEKFIGKELAQAASKKPASEPQSVNDKTNQSKTDATAYYDSTEYDSTQASSEDSQPELVLKCEHLSKAGEYQDISFSLHSGEILCVTGLIGAKRTELMHSLFGSSKPDSGSITLLGKKYHSLSPAHAIEQKIGFVPEDRHRDGLLMQASVQNNLLLASLNKVAKFGIISQAKVKKIVQHQISQLNIKPNDPNKTVAKLSGGNQQKVLIGKWLERQPKLLILDEPTVGVDVGAKSEIYQIIKQLKSTGTAVIVVSSDMEEVMSIADRIMVMCAGKQQGIYRANQVSQQQVINYVGGGTTP